MKNVTIALSGDVMSWLQVGATANGRNVSKRLGDLLEGIRRLEGEYKVTMKRFLAGKPLEMRWSDGRKPKGSRDENT